MTRFAHRLLAADGRVEALLLAVAVLLVMVFLILPPDQLPELASYGLAGSIGSVMIALFYTILFWLLLSLVYIGIRSGRALSQLAGQPLTVNVFDPDPLLPFGRLSLAQSLTFVGMFLIPLIIMGPPTRQGGGWLVIGLSVLCLLALFVPLWGVHRQIVEAREEVLGRVCGDLMEIQRSLLGCGRQDTEQLHALSQRTEVLFQFRKQILECSELALPRYRFDLPRHHCRNQPADLLHPESARADLPLSALRTAMTGARSRGNRFAASAMPVAQRRSLPCRDIRPDRG